MVCGWIWSKGYCSLNLIQRRCLPKRIVLTFSLFFSFPVFFENETSWKGMSVHAVIASVGTRPEPTVFVILQGIQEVLAYLEG